MWSGLGAMKLWIFSEQKSRSVLQLYAILH